MTVNIYKIHIRNSLTIRACSMKGLGSTKIPCMLEDIIPATVLNFSIILAPELEPPMLIDRVVCIAVECVINNPEDCLLSFAFALG